MSGLILLLALAICLWAGIWLVSFVVRKVPNPKWKTPVMVGLTLFLLTAPFVDEVIGKYQFEALCKANGIESADVSKARGKRVKVDYGERTFVKGTTMPIMVSDVVFLDPDSAVILIRLKNYYAEGGWVMRYTPLSMGSSHAMLFSGNGCGFSERNRIFKANQIIEVN